MKPCPSCGEKITIIKLTNVETEELMGFCAICSSRLKELPSECHFSEMLEGKTFAEAEAQALEILG